MDIRQALDRARLTLRDVRARRPRPHLDDKVLTAWNGLMIGAFARAARVLDGSAEAGHHDYLGAARRAAEFIRSQLWKEPTQTLLRRYRQGDAAVEAYAEDYAYLIFGLLELFQADGDPSWLEWALTLQRRQDELFWDDADGAWFSTTGRDASVLLRLKEDYDGAEPAASSVSVLNLLTLAHLTGDASFTAKIEMTFSAFGGRIAQSGRTAPMLLAALSTYYSGVPQIVIVGDQQALRPMLDVLRRHYLPTAILVRGEPQHREALARLLPWTASMKSGPSGATAYVCRDFACEQPADTPAELDQRLSTVSARH